MARVENWLGGLKGGSVNAVLKNFLFHLCYSRFEITFVRFLIHLYLSHVFKDNWIRFYF